VINKLGITDQVYILLRDRILRRVLLPGERVHIDLLAQELGVSRTPIRDALTRLAGEGLISILPRRGTFVSRPSAKEFLDLLDVRLGLESWAAAKTVERLSEADLQTLAGLQEEMVEAVARLEESPFEHYMSFVELNRQFHRTIVQSSGNEKLSAIYQSIDSAAHVQRVVFPVPKKTLDRGNDEHAEIVAALRARDWPRLEQAITIHVETLKQDLLQNLVLAEQNGDEAGAAPEKGGDARSTNLVGYSEK